MKDVFNQYLEYVQDDILIIEINNDDDIMNILRSHENGILSRFAKGGYSLSPEGKWRCAADYFKKESGVDLIFGDSFSMQDVIDEVDWEEMNAEIINAIDDLEDIKESIEEFINDARTNNMQDSDIDAAIDEWIEDLRRIALSV